MFQLSNISLPGIVPWKCPLFSQQIAYKIRWIFQLSWFRDPFRSMDSDGQERIYGTRRFNAPVPFFVKQKVRKKNSKFWVRCVLLCYMK